MRADRTGKARRPRLRWRLPGTFRAPVIPSWAVNWKATLQQTPAAQWLAACWRSPFAGWVLDHWRLLAEAGLYLGAYLVYVFSRGLFYDNVREIAIFNGDRVAELQRQLWFLWEPGWQAWAIEHVKPIVVFLNWTYILTYWPVILALAAYLFLRKRREYYYFRTVVVIDLCAALVVFALFPVASPFAIPGVGLVDTIQAFGPTFYGSDSMAIFYNTNAAMPSLHFSWTVILGVYWLRSLPGGFKAAGVLYPTLTFFAITITGNHFVLDAVVGGALAGLSFGAVEGYRAVAARVSQDEIRASWSTFRRKVRQLQIPRTLIRW